MTKNQIAYPWDYDAMPEVEAVKPEHLFDCDVFVFVASKGIPPVGSGVKDVRMYQFENNAKIMAHYAKMARESRFKRTVLRCFRSRWIPWQRPHF